MTGNSAIVRYSLEEVLALRLRGKDPLDPDAPEGPPLDEHFWKNARLVLPRGKTSVHLRVDSDIVEWFRSHGKGHLTRMNAVLRAYVDAQK